MTEATQAGETESATRTAWLPKLNRFQRLYWDWVAAARAAFYDPDAPEDDKVTNTLSDKHDAAELALLVEPSPLTWGVWVKWEILDRLVTADAIIEALDLLGAAARTREGKPPSPAWAAYEQAVQEHEREVDAGLR